MNKPGDAEITASSGNVFADLGLPNAEEALAKADLAIAIGDAITERGLTQRQAGARLGLDQPKVSALLRGRLSGFSVERLMRCLQLLQRNVDIVVSGSPQPFRVGHVRVVVESKPKPTKGASASRAQVAIVEQDHGASTGSYGRSNKPAKRKRTGLVEA